MKLRYVLVFVLGMICMYWLVRAGVIDAGTSQSSQVLTGMVEQSTDATGNTTIVVGATGVVETVSGSATNTGSSSTGISVEQTVEMMKETSAIKQPPVAATGSMSTGSTVSTGATSIDVIDVPSGASYTKQQACSQPNGSYTTPIQVGWNDALKASTKGFVKLGGFVHYIVNVSDGSKYYYYYNCTTGLATNAKNLTNTQETRLVLSQGQVYLR